MQRYPKGRGKLKEGHILLRKRDQRQTEPRPFLTPIRLERGEQEGKYYWSLLLYISTNKVR